MCQLREIQIKYYYYARVLYYYGSYIRNICMVSNKLFTELAMGLIELE